MYESMPRTGPMLRRPGARRFTLAALGLLLAALASTTASARGLNVAGDLVGKSNGSTELRVYSVQPGGLADRVGVLPGDAILSINGYPPGDSVVNEHAVSLGRGWLSVDVRRRGHKLTLEDAVSNLLGSATQLAVFNPRPLKPIFDQRSQGLDIRVSVFPYPDSVEIKILEAIHGGLGSKLGLCDGDVIERVNGRIIPSLTAFAGAVRRSGIPLKLRVRDSYTQQRRIVFVP